MDDQGYTDEVNLYEYFKIIYEWKFLIIALCLITVVATFVITNRLVPTTYNVTAVISSDSLSYTPDGKSMPVDSATNIQALIKNGVLNQKIIETLKFGPAQYSAMQFSPQILKNTEFISVSYETPEPEKGKAIVSELINQLSKSYKTKFVLNQEEASKQSDKLKNTLMLQQNKKERNQGPQHRLRNQKERLQNDKEVLQNQKERLQNNKERKQTEKKKVEFQSEFIQKQLALQIASEKKFQDLLKTAEENMNVLVNEKNELLKKGTNPENTSLIFYSNTIQQAFYRIDKLHSDIENKKMAQEVTRNQLINNDIILENLDIDVNDIDTQIKEIEVNITSRLKNLDIDVNDIDTQIKDIAVNTKNLNIQIKDVDSQIKELITQEKDIDTETLTYLKEIESITKRGTASSERIKVMQEPNAIMVAKRTVNKMAIAGVLALFIGIMLAFFIEYIKRTRASS